ncbi:Gfo/Idh/MocA family protein [Paraburkholderia humisilvae]|uniref:Inositol 2-dehydrogenase/D-chiro-inositol 3-dehydrogenase n=1 Tax=Paraburkholderia humisilvae TaxID=627669 RepID=A0A6J5EJV6_9BURK|nr:Gfo/Idh/MocA family oxidoreductase [Paraburkholderia humisilvae]CAB3766829.1 Inositol 2-dehydrogenase/D-chiro-inositol 3-dehydrogenase [Paraburkholderia humisilvae]
MTVIDIGIVGLGVQMQENLLPTLLQMPNVRIVAVCDLSASRAAQIHRFIPEVPITDSVDKMLSLASPDALVLACPPQAHRDFALQAMKAGIHIFVEKPPCFTLDELSMLVEANRSSRVVTGVGMNFKFAKPVQQLREMTLSESFGDTLHIQLNHYASKPRTPMWGLDSTLRSFLLAQAIHTIDLGITFGGGELTGIQSRVQHHEDSLLVNAEFVFSSGTTASVLCGTVFPYFEFDMKLVSSNSTMVELDNLWNITLHEPEHGTRATGAAKRWRGAWQPGPLDSGYERSGYYGELFGFFEAIRQKKPFEASFESLLPTYRVIEHICANDPHNSEIPLGIAASAARHARHESHSLLSNANLETGSNVL